MRLELLARATSVIVVVALAPGEATAQTAQFVETTEIVHEWSGENPGDRFGRVTRILDDVDGDGIRDIAIASPHNRDGGFEAGKLYVFSGRTGELIRSHQGETSWNLGNELANAGDFNGDGVSDYIVGAPSGLSSSPTGPGRAFLFSGQDGSLLQEWAGEAEGDRFGRFVVGGGNQIAAGIGDVTGDAVPDLLIGAPNHDAGGPEAGRVYVYSGARLDTPVLVVDGASPGDNFGLGIGGLGDLDSDRCGDFVVGAPQNGNDGRGRAHVLRGCTGEPLLPAFEGDASSVALGALFTSGPGDVNGDGTPDIFVTDFAGAAQGASTGQAWVLSGLDGSTIHTFTGSTAGEGLGVGRGCDDVDLDGFPDLLVAAFRSGAGGTNAGRAFVYSGKDGSALRVMTNTTPFDFFGWSADCADVDGDGAIDYLISAALSNARGSEAGRVFLIAGRSS